MECPRCKGKMRVKDHQLPQINEDGMMPCPHCEGEGDVGEMNNEELIDAIEGFLSENKVMTYEDLDNIRERGYI